MQEKLENYLFYDKNSSHCKLVHNLKYYIYPELERRWAHPRHL